MVKKEWPLTKALLQCSREFQEAQVGRTAEQKAELGLYHIRMWDAWLQFLHNKLTQESEKYPNHIMVLNQYIEYMKQIGTEKLVDEIKLIRCGKACNKDCKKLQVHVCPAHARSWKIWTDVIRASLMQSEEHQGVRKMHGSEPKGELERRLQQQLPKSERTE